MNLFYKFVIFSDKYSSGIIAMKTSLDDVLLYQNCFYTTKGYIQLMYTIANVNHVVLTLCYVVVFIGRPSYR